MVMVMVMVVVVVMTIQLKIIMIMTRLVFTRMKDTMIKRIKYMKTLAAAMVVLDLYAMIMIMITITTVTIIRKETLKGQDGLDQTGKPHSYSNLSNKYESR